MAWWGPISAFLFEEDARPIEAPKTASEAVKTLLMVYLADGLYYTIGFFTALYFFAIAFLFFFGGKEGYYFISTTLLEALSEPYLVSLSFYVVLKELRKRRITRKSRHLGEVYVALWLLLLVIFSKEYHFDAIMKLIIATSLASFVIYTAGVIHKP